MTISACTFTVDDLDQREPRVLRLVRPSTTCACSSAQDCGLLRYPPTTACPFCAHAESELGTRSRPRHRLFLRRGAPRHPAGVQAHTPYLLLLVELDEQKGEPTEHDGLRVCRQSRHARRRPGAAGAGAQGRHRLPACAWCSRTVGDGIALPHVDPRRGRAAASQTLALSAGIAAHHSRPRHQGRTMPIYENGPVKIHYEEAGSGFPAARHSRRRA